MKLVEKMKLLNFSQFKYNKLLLNSQFKWPISDQAWRERDAALLRDQMAQTQMYSMREKLEAVESAVKNEMKKTRDE